MAELTWQEKVKIEAKQITIVVYENFKHCINMCMGYAPDELNKENRIEVFATCSEALVGAMVNTLCTYGDTGEAFEQTVIDEVKNKFKWIRENQAKLDKQKKIGLVGIDS